MSSVPSFMSVIRHLECMALTFCLLPATYIHHRIYAMLHSYCIIHVYSIYRELCPSLVVTYRVNKHWRCSSPYNIGKESLIVCGYYVAYVHILLASVVLCTRVHANVRKRSMEVVSTYKM